MKEKSWGEATREKQEIEQAQRERTRVRKEKGEEWTPRYFEGDVSLACFASFKMSLSLACPIGCSS